MEQTTIQKKMRAKLETPSRLRELDPANTLYKIGFQANDVLADIGVGTGIFAIPAAEEPAKRVYALDIDDQALDLVDRKAREAGLRNVRTVRIKDGEYYDVPTGKVDVALLSCTLHEVSDAERTKIFSETARILSKNGVFAVIEFQPDANGFGPPQSIRVSKETLEDYAREQGFEVKDRFDLSRNLYCMVLQKAGK